MFNAQGIYNDMQNMAGQLGNKNKKGQPAQASVTKPPAIDPNYQNMEQMALQLLSQWSNGQGLTSAGQDVYNSGKQALDQSLQDQKKFLSEDAVRRGIYNSGVLTSNYNKAYGEYNRGLNDLNSQKVAVDQQNQVIRQNALQSILGYRPLSYEQDMALWEMQNQSDQAYNLSNLQGWWNLENTKQQGKDQYNNEHANDGMGFLSTLASIASFFV